MVIVIEQDDDPGLLKADIRLVLWRRLRVCRHDSSTSLSVPDVVMVAGAGDEVNDGIRGRISLPYATPVDFVGVLH
jgi:hypothetical protein